MHILIQKNVLCCFFWGGALGQVRQGGQDRGEHGLHLPAGMQVGQGRLDRAAQGRVAQADHGVGPSGPGARRQGVDPVVVGQAPGAGLGDELGEGGDGPALGAAEPERALTA